MTTTAGITPVIAGIGQVANKDEGRIVDPITLIEEAARAALDDAHIGTGRIDGVLATPLTSLGDQRAPARWWPNGSESRQDCDRYPRSVVPLPSISWRRHAVP